MGEFDSSAKKTTISACIVTYERADFLRRCLESLNRLDSSVDDVVVVDASAEHHGASLEELGLPLEYLWVPEHAGHRIRARNVAMEYAVGEVIAYLDDDVVVHAGWADGLRRAFHDPSVAAVAGRTLNGQPGEEHYDPPIGRYLDRGRLTEGFAALTDGPVEADHGIGANMSFRREVLQELGGAREGYPGPALREETDLFLRVRSLGRRVVFEPSAVVDHLPAPHVTGSRFDTRYRLYHRRNHMVLVARHEGIGSRNLWRWVGDQLTSFTTVDGVVAKVRRIAVTWVGCAWGLAALPRSARWRPLQPRRSDPEADEIRRRMAGSPTR